MANLMRGCKSPCLKREPIRDQNPAFLSIKNSGRFLQRCKRMGKPSQFRMNLVVNTENPCGNLRVNNLNYAEFLSTRPKLGMPPPNIAVEISGYKFNVVVVHG